MHTDDTIAILDQSTTHLGADFRKFANNTCPAFSTHELKRESDSRKRRLSKKSQGASGLASKHPVATSDSDEGPLEKTFSLKTYKFHALGDYVEAIRRYGTTDSYSTEPVSSLRYLPFHADSAL